MVIADPQSVYNPKIGHSGFEKRPHSIYFYYVGPGDIAAGHATHYYDTNNNQEINAGNIEQVIRRLARNATLAPRLRNPPPYGEDGKYLVWTRISYIAFLIDDPQYSFEDPALVIDPNLGLPNHTFFDGHHGPIDLAEGGEPSKVRHVFWCINHMKARASTGPTDPPPHLGYDNQKFYLTLNPVKQGASIEGESEQLAISWPDSGGTNMGPPVPPPP